MACLLVILLLIFWQYAGQYNKLSENLAVSSKFNLSFKDELDLEMYYLAIGSKEASELDDVCGTGRGCTGDYGKTASKIHTMPVASNV